VLVSVLASCGGGQPADEVAGIGAATATSSAGGDRPGDAAGGTPGSAAGSTTGSTPRSTTTAGHDHGDDHHAHDTPVAEGARTVAVDATSFEFEPAEITVVAGEDVAIALTSDDVLHDFAVEGVEVHVAAERGETAEGGLRVDEPGEYRIICTVEGHLEAGMEGTLIVEPGPA
jgi:plastocyanin